NPFQLARGIALSFNELQRSHIAQRLAILGIGVIERSDPGMASYRRADRLANFPDLGPWIGTEFGQAVRHRLYRKRLGAGAIPHLLPEQRGRHRGARAGTRRIGADRGGAAAVAQVVEVDAALPCLFALVRGELPWGLRDKSIRDPFGESLGGVP